MRVRAVHKSEIFALALLIFAMGLEAARPSNAASDNTNHVLVAIQAETCQKLFRVKPVLAIGKSKSFWGCGSLSGTAWAPLDHATLAPLDR